MSVHNDLSLTDDDPLFRETHYARYGYERTNIFGLVTLDSHLLTYINRPKEFPSNRFDVLPSTPVPEYTQPLIKPARHFLAASFSEISAFVSRDGYWNCFSIDVGLVSGQSEVIAIDAVESMGSDHKIKLLLCLAVAEKSDQERMEPSYSYSLRIYGNKPDTKPFLEQALHSIGDTCQTISLTSAPMQITHVPMKGDLK
ncbi:hypothetical protein EDC96DRAFT_94264 [Choanephora cucurbitarum]|nr:hypothetical protein EDC96DRAFT_94264 [Choanephora cucurbitarum]